MNILKKFTFKNVKLNKKRSIVTIIGIVLSTALICTVAGMFSSFQKTMVNAIIKDEGDYHAVFKNVQKEDIKYIKENRNIQKYYLEEYLGFVKYNNIKYSNEEYFNLKAYDKDYLKEVTLESGRLPKNSNEVVIAKAINEEAKYKLGDKISFDIYYGEDGVDYFYDEDGNIDLKYKNNKEYEVVGIINSEYRYGDYIGITLLDNISSNIDIKVKYKNIRNTYKITKEIKKDYEVEYNSELLRWSLVASTDDMRKTLLSLLSIVIGIIVISSIFVIRNSFAISTTEKMKQFGMLSSIGATKKQIRKSVIYEGFILGIIGIPLGILLGIIVVYILIIFSNFMLVDMLNEIEFVFNIPIEAILISIILGGVTIFLSSISSAYKASKVSPIEAIRSNNDIKIKGKKLKTPKIINKLFGIGGEIAYKNLKRNKKKYRTTVISLVVSITIFIALSTFIHYGFNVSNMYYKNLPYNVYVSDTSDVENTIKNYNKVLKLKNIDSYSIKRVTELETDRRYLIDNNIMYGDEKEITISLLSIGEVNYKEYVKSLHLDYEKVKDKIIYVENTSYMYDKEIVKTFNFKEKDKIKGIVNGKEKELEIAKITKKGDFGIDNYAYGIGAFIISDYLIEKLGVNYVNNLEIDSPDSYKLEEDIKNLKIDTIEVENIDLYQKQMNNMVIWISVFLYGFIIVITLIGVTNIFNTITTNMNLRSKEFAMLKSVGMTKKEFNRMIRLESIFYGLKSLIIGCILGTIFSYLIYKGLSNSIDFGFQIPIKAIIISIIFILIVVGMIMKYSLNKINKQNIIETIRKDNI
ncbi:MAG: ABC transporter permease [Bacilli bacterium]|nr:ABC transporter permease [Bacilli bacterium]